MNTLLGVVWGLINPDMFQGVADTLEDVMQASVPGIIENVRVAEINQGSNPIRILSLRALPDTHMGELKKSIHEENKKTKDPQEAAADEEGGDFYNLEVSFAYHAKPSGKRASDKARNMHMQLVFYLGIKGLFGVPLPIFVELQGLVGTVRLRMNMTPEPPFLKTLTFTLMGTPQVQAGCIPMMEKAPNVLNLPLISNFVNYAIGAAASSTYIPFETYMCIADANSTSVCCSQVNVHRYESYSPRRFYPEGCRGPWCYVDSYPSRCWSQQARSPRIRPRWKRSIHYTGLLQVWQANVLHSCHHR